MMTSVNSSITSSESQTGHTLEFDLAKDGNLPTRVGKLFRNIISSSADSSHKITISLDTYKEDCKREGISKRTYFKRVFENLVEQAAGETQTLAQEKANAINTTAWGIFCDIISFNWIGGFFGKGREQALAQGAKEIFKKINQLTGGEQSSKGLKTPQKSSVEGVNPNGYGSKEISAPWVFSKERASVHQALQDKVNFIRESEEREAVYLHTLTALQEAIKPDEQSKFDFSYYKETYNSLRVALMLDLQGELDNPSGAIGVQDLNNLLSVIT